MTWDEIRGDSRYRNRWIALDHCRYAEDGHGAEPAEADVVDCDDDLSELCSRLNNADQKHCAIVFCEDQTAELSPNLLRLEHRAFLRAS